VRSLQGEVPEKGGRGSRLDREPGVIERGASTESDDWRMGDLTGEAFDRSIFKLTLMFTGVGGDMFVSCLSTR